MNNEQVNRYANEIHDILDGLKGITLPPLPPHILELCEQLRQSADEILTLSDEEF